MDIDSPYRVIKPFLGGSYEKAGDSQELGAGKIIFIASVPKDNYVSINISGIKGIFCVRVSDILENCKPVKKK